MNPRIKAAAIFAVVAALGVTAFSLDGQVQVFDIVFGVYIGAFLVYILIRTGYFAERVPLKLPGETRPTRQKMRKSAGGKRFSATQDATFMSASEAESAEGEVQPHDRVIGLEYDGHAVAYPLTAMGLREVANEEFESGDVCVTWWPVSYSARAFTPTRKGEELELGPSVHTVLNSSVLYDEARNGYVQFSGDCVMGLRTGDRLNETPVLLTTWEAWRSAHPDTEVMSKQGTPEIDIFERYYANSRAGLYSQRTKDKRLAAKEVVFGLQVGEESMAWPFKSLIEEPLHRATVGGRDVLVVHERLSSTAAAFAPSVGGRTLTFESLTENPRRNTDPELEEMAPYEPWLLRDTETGSTWRAVSGECTEGELSGERLELLPGHTGFWFAWSKFHPHTALYESPLPAEIPAATA